MVDKATYNTYLNQIGRVPLLTPEQEIKLGRQVQRAEQLRALDRELTDAEQREVRLGDRAAQRFVQANLRLVVNVAKKYVRIAKSMDLMDLIQEGNMGLFTGVRKYDPTLGYKFSTYAYWWIRQGIMRSIHYKDRVIRLPGNIGAMAYSWSSKYCKLQAELGRVPTREELAETFKVTLEDLDLFLERGGHVSTIDKTAQDGDGFTLKDMIVDPDYLDGEEALESILYSERAQSLQTAMLCLSKREQEIIAKRWGLDGYEPQTLGEIGKGVGISRERVRQLLDIAYRRIRYNFNQRDCAEAMDRQKQSQMVGVGRPIA